jgi:hypothetical protein
MSSLPTYLSVVTVDIEAGVEKEFNRWYDEVHVPEVLACPGWEQGARYVAVEGSPRYMAVYEMSGPEAMWTPELQAIKGFGPYWKSLEAYRSVVYRKITPERDG